MDEIRRQLHNEAVMEEMKRIERDVRSSVRAGEQDPHVGTPLSNVSISGMVLSSPIVWSTSNRSVLSEE